MVLRVLCLWRYSQEPVHYGPLLERPVSALGGPPAPDGISQGPVSALSIVAFNTY
jgi:hypothetical protein